jgi:D-amino-acid oxidase
VSPKRAQNEDAVLTKQIGGGTIVGGCYQLGNFESQVDPNLATKMMANAIKYNPALVKPGEGVEALSIIRQGVGLRPVRTSGVRIEKEKKDSKSPWIVHCYGHGGWGYQTSYGSAAKVQELVNEIAAPTAKL